LPKISCHGNAFLGNEKMATFETQTITDHVSAWQPHLQAVVAELSVVKFLTPAVLNSGFTEPNLTKISNKVENWWRMKALKSEFQY